MNNEQAKKEVRLSENQAFKNEVKKHLEDYVPIAVSDVKLNENDKEYVTVKIANPFGGLPYTINSYNPATGKKKVSDGYEAVTVKR